MPKIICPLVRLFVTKINTVICKTSSGRPVPGVHVVEGIAHHDKQHLTFLEGKLERNAIVCCLAFPLQFTNERICKPLFHDPYRSAGWYYGNTGAHYPLTGSWIVRYLFTSQIKVYRIDVAPLLRFSKHPVSRHRLLLAYSCVSPSDSPRIFFFFSFCR